MIFNELIKNTIFVFIIKHTLSTKILKKFEPANIYGDEKVLTINDLKMRMMVVRITTDISQYEKPRLC